MSCALSRSKEVFETLTMRLPFLKNGYYHFQRESTPLEESEERTPFGSIVELELMGLHECEVLAIQDAFFSPSPLLGNECFCNAHQPQW